MRYVARHPAGVSVVSPSWLTASESAGKPNSNCSRTYLRLSARATITFERFCWQAIFSPVINDIPRRPRQHFVREANLYNPGGRFALTLPLRKSNGFYEKLVCY